MPAFRVALAFSLVLLGSPIFAAPPAVDAGAKGPKVVVLAAGFDSLSKTQLGLLEHAGEAAIQRANRFVSMPVADVFDPAAKAQHLAAYSQATRQVSDGEKALEELDTVKASELFTEALSLLRQSNPVNHFAALIHAWVLKAASHATAGEHGPARQDIERIIALDAKAEFQKQYFPPELLEFAETQRRIAGNAKGELTVRTEPPGAAVWVDGQYRGTSPAFVPSIMGGRHVVNAVLGGYSLGQEELTPGEGLVTLKSAPLQSVLVAAQDAMAREPEGLVREQSAMSLGKKVGADQVLVLMAKKSLAGEQLDLTLMRVDAADGHNWAYQTAVVPMNDESTLNGVLDVVMNIDAPRSGKRPVFHQRSERASMSGKRAAGIALLGAGAALAGAGIYSALQAQSVASQYRMTPQVETNISQQLAARGRGFALVADLSFIFAAGSFTLGSIFVATGGRDDDGPLALAPGSQAPAGVDAVPLGKERAPSGKPVRETSDWSKAPRADDEAAAAAKKAEEARLAREAEAEAAKKNDEQPKPDEPKMSTGKPAKNKKKR